MMRIASLGSGSKGNATIVCEGSTQILIDCGFGLKDIEARLRNRGIHPESLSAILVTHEHGDHLKGAPILANRYDIPLYSTAGTSRYFKRPVKSAKTFHMGERLSVGSIDIEPVTVPHDCAEPSQFIFRHQDKTFGLLTDLGSLTPHVKAAYHECQVIMLECNHDVQMLDNGPYPASLKRRVGGNYGHLSNRQAADLLSTMNQKCLTNVLVSHVSEQNNDPLLARDSVQSALKDQHTNIEFLTQQEGCDWISLPNLDA